MKHIPTPPTRAPNLLPGAFAGWIGASLVILGVTASGPRMSEVGCGLPAPTVAQAVDVAAAVKCVVADEQKGVTDPAAIASDCKLASAQVASDILSTLRSRMHALCPPPKGSAP